MEGIVFICGRDGIRYDFKLNGVKRNQGNNKNVCLRYLR